MNDGFKTLVQKTNKSLYRISHESGIPYTTLSELSNEKKDINRIASETVYKLCLYLHCDMSELLNPVPLLANQKGTYRKIPYQWIKTESKVDLQIYTSDGEVTLVELNQVLPDTYRYSRELIEMVIDTYLAKKKNEELINESIQLNA